MPHQRALADLRLDEIDREARRAVAHVERRVQFDDVEWGQVPGRIRQLEGISSTETSLLPSTFKL